MTFAEKILTVSDRTPKERLRMADFYAKSFDWKGDLITYWFEDESGFQDAVSECKRNARRDVTNHFDAVYAEGYERGREAFNVRGDDGKDYFPDSAWIRGRTRPSAARHSGRCDPATTRYE